MSNFTPISLSPMPEDFSVAVCALPVSAGFPSPAGDDLEDEIDPIAWIVRRPGSTFWWRVQGDCLEDVGIRHGDLIAVDRAGTKKLGRIVLAIIDGDITAKILARDKRGYWLRPANRKANYKDIPFTETTEVWGVVAGVVRRYEVE